MNIDITLTIRLAPALEALIGAALGAAPAPVAREKTVEEREAVSRPTETASAPSAESEPDTSGSATAASAASPKATRGRKSSSAQPETGAPAADPFALPTAGSAAPASSTETASSAAPASDVTPQAVQAAMNDYMKTHSAAQLKALFEGNFVAADGGPASSFSKLQPKDYAAVLAKLAE